MKTAENNAEKSVEILASILEEDWIQPNSREHAQDAKRPQLSGTLLKTASRRVEGKN